MLMFLLANSIKKTASICEGWSVGRLVIEDAGAMVELDKGGNVAVGDNHRLEVLNGNEWQFLKNSDLSKKTIEGWPLFGGFDVRIMI